MTAPLIIERVVLLGPARTYEVRLRPGFNVIAGPIFTGKSTVLKLIDYALGSKDAPAYPEISKCPDVYVQLRVVGELLTVERSLRDKNSRATIHYGDVEAARTRTAETLAVSPVHQTGTASISSELLRRLGLDDVMIKRAPTKESSDVAAFSIRGLLRFVNLSQTRMGQDHVFFEDDFVRSNEWKQGFEILHGLHSPIEARLSKALEDAQKEEGKVQHFLKSADGFLDGAKVPGAEDLEREIAELEGQRERLSAELARLKTDTEASLGEDSALLRKHDELVGARDTAQAQAAEIRRALDPLGRLKVQYGREQAQLEFLAESEVLVGRLPIIRCPGCLRAIEATPTAHQVKCHVCHGDLRQTAESVPVDARLRSIRKRISDLDTYMKELQDRASGLGERAAALTADIRSIAASLERIRTTTLFPQSRRQVEANEALSRVERRIEKAADQLELRKRSRGEGSRLLAIQQTIRTTKRELEKAIANKRSPAEVIAQLSGLFVETLERIRFPVLRGASIDPTTYRPLVRDQSYVELRSKGAIALVLTSWHLALVRFSLGGGTSLHPKLLLLDSPLSHVGRHSADIAFRDQQIVDAFYRLFSELDESASADFQVILVDNRPPDSARQYVVVEFTGDPGQGRIGLVDDEVGDKTSQRPPTTRPGTEPQ